jgi:hypothetical protein
MGLETRAGRADVGKRLRRFSSLDVDGLTKSQRVATHLFSKTRDRCLMCGGVSTCPLDIQEPDMASLRININHAEASTRADYQIWLRCL